MKTKFVTIDKSSWHYKLIRKKIEKYLRYNPYRTITQLQYIYWTISSVVVVAIWFYLLTNLAWVIGNTIIERSLVSSNNHAVLKNIIGFAVILGVYGFYRLLVYLPIIIENGKTIVVFTNKHDIKSNKNETTDK